MVALLDLHVVAVRIAGVVEPRALVLPTCSRRTWSRLPSGRPSSRTTADPDPSAAAGRRSRYAPPLLEHVQHQHLVRRLHDLERPQLEQQVAREPGGIAHRGERIVDVSKTCAWTVPGLEGGDFFRPRPSTARSRDRGAMPAPPASQMPVMSRGAAGPVFGGRLRSAAARRCSTPARARRDHQERGQQTVTLTTIRRFKCESFALLLRRPRRRRGGAGAVAHRSARWAGRRYGGGRRARRS